MANMNVNVIRSTARDMTINCLHDALEACDAVQFADNSFAILQQIDDMEVWTEVTVKSKNWKDTKTSTAFDPFEAAEAWKEEERIKAENRAAKLAEKAAKIEKDKKKREETA